MTCADRAAAVAAFGFTARQARFLVLVMLHAGVCMRRQYGTYTGLVYGQQTRDFFDALVRRRVATPYPAAHGRARLFHVHRRSLYEAIGDRDSRHRKPMALPRAVERLMVLDAVLASPDLTWLATERDKLAYFTPFLAARVDRAGFPHLRFGASREATVRYFPDRLPIGVPTDGTATVFTYLVTRPVPVDFRPFLRRHATLLGALPTWTVRLLVPGHLVDAVDRYEAAWREELASPLRLSTGEELQWYFAHRQQRTAGGAGAPDGDNVRYARARDAFGAPRFRGLYRAWRRDGAAALADVASSVLRDAMVRGTGRLETQVLAHPYLHLASQVATA